jgi:hypothetical protein
MSTSATQLWSLWRESPEIREFAEAWLTKSNGQWTDDDERLAELYGFSPSRSKCDPDRALAVMLAIMQLAESPQVLGSLGAGHLETFLGLHGENYLEVFHELALAHQRLRETLENVWQGAMPKRVWQRIEILKQSAFS